MRPNNGQCLSNLQLRRLSSRVSPLQTGRRRETELESQLIAEQERAHELENQLSRTQGRVHELERQLREALNHLSRTQGRVDELEIQLREDWVINQNDIQIMADEELGRGAWGVVYKGTFHGCDVAVKEMYENIMSPNTRHVFEREVSMASKCRHPCLVQFIGATTDERPLLVTELMDYSLREKLYRNPRGGQLLSADVARALNYLHEKPKPIVHNDVSSANVLLWRYGSYWRAKLSVYGTANFVRQSNINYAGAVVYSAPESQNENPDHPISCKVSCNQ